MPIGNSCETFHYGCLFSSSEGNKLLFLHLLVRVIRSYFLLYGKHDKCGFCDAYKTEIKILKTRITRLKRRLADNQAWWAKSFQDLCSEKSFNHAGMQ